MSSARAEPSFTASGKIVRALVDVVETYGVSEAQLLRAASFHCDAAVLAETRLPSVQIHRLLDAALELTADPAFGLRWADSCKDAVFNPLHLMFEYAPTLRQALDALASYARVLTDQPRFCLVELGSNVAIRCIPPASSGATRRLMVEMQLGRFVRMIRGVTPEPPLQVSFDYAAPPYRTLYTRVFHGRERFQQPHCEIVLEAEVLDRPSQWKDNDVHSAMRTIAERRNMELMNNLPLSQRILELLVQHGPGERVEMATVARWLGISERSMRRHLEAEGKRYPDIASEAQAALARNMLLHTRRSIQDIAWTMGFVNASAFHHAFKRWTGSTPRDFRNQRAPRSRDRSVAL